ncbi:lipopolysaccharide heptosyltransferase II [Helicobacter sp. MIT 05-5294]|uniref:lipopolysaccharide heptosyltransferase II n=1 Tax=Helicobacter sp. MIT 05-5294 TaxID=1548150 RepID=UPI000AC1AFD1|nr:lipopolysaccharide heptosyltransferase II [Helicobacter sp. MIT 05-5294]TLD89098.1 lipopolysaccharide heptosyltransferase II [Helicobacter sp. MIT 05-5294]
MNILVRIPNWLGDAVMATYALEILFLRFPHAHFYLVGSGVSIALFAHYPRVSVIEDRSKKAKFRIPNLYSLAKSIPPCDLGFTFQNNLLSALLLFFNRTKFRVGFSTEMRSFLLTLHPQKPKNLHEALRFSTLIESTLHAPKFQKFQVQHNDPNALESSNAIPNPTPKLYLNPPPKHAITQAVLPQHFKDSKIAGINAGAAFGAAKRWEESHFALVIEFLLRLDFKVILFGVQSENAINEKILKSLQEIPHFPQNLQANILNLSGKTTIESLMAYFVQLDFLLTNDSGPMHIASAFGIPTLALFGPTNTRETCPFNAENSHILSLETLGQPLQCAPCMKRTCPLPKDSAGFHACMRHLTPNLVIAKIQSIISKLEIQSNKNTSEPL